MNAACNLTWLAISTDNATCVVSASSIIKKGYFTFCPYIYTFAIGKARCAFPWNKSWVIKSNASPFVKRGLATEPPTSERLLTWLCLIIKLFFSIRSSLTYVRISIADSIDKWHTANSHIVGYISVLPDSISSNYTYVNSNRSGRATFCNITTSHLFSLLLFKFALQMFISPIQCIVVIVNAKAFHMLY